ncbi:MAG: hypothetical protein ACOCUR_00820 [Nanoarchaeota archaeon]
MNRKGNANLQLWGLKRPVPIGLTLKNKAIKKFDSTLRDYDAE